MNSGSTCRFTENIVKDGSSYHRIAPFNLARQVVQISSAPSVIDCAGDDPGDGGDDPVTILVTMFSHLF